MNDIELSHDEQVLYNHIVWDGSEFAARSPEEQEDAQASAAELVRLLYARKAIPQIRLDMFSKPELNLAGRGKSPLQLLEQSNVTTRDPRFLRHLWFFIHGPRLPNETIIGSQRITDRTIETFDDIIKALLDFVRIQSRKHGFGAADATECEKLAHELGWGRYADQFRKASLSGKH